MKILASTVQYGFPQDITGAYFAVYFVIWMSGFILQCVINRRMKTMAKQGVQGLPVTSFMGRSFRTGWEKWVFFLKGKYRLTGDRSFILLCEIYRISFVLIALMLVVAAFFLTHRSTALCPL